MNWAVKWRRWVWYVGAKVKWEEGDKRQNKEDQQKKCLVWLRFEGWNDDD